MGQQSDTIRLFTQQHRDVTRTLERDGVCFSKAEYVRRKYWESAPIFLTAYTWLAKESARFVPKPDAAELQYWAFTDPSSIEPSGDSQILVLDVPVAACVFFDLHDWNKVLSLQYLGADDAEEARFRSRLQAYGIKHDSDILLTGFYPDLKREILASWQRLFRYHDAIARGERPFPSIQAALWQITRAWTADAGSARANP